MDDERCRQFFLEPTETAHRKYEALRALFVEERQLPEIAQQFGYQESSLRSMISRFRTQMQSNDLHPFLFERTSDGPQIKLVPPQVSRRKRRRSLTGEC